MANNTKPSPHWEKVGVYLALLASVLTIISFLMDLKNNISSDRERITKLEIEMHYFKKSNN